MGVEDPCFKGHLDCFQFGVIMNKGAVNIFTQLLCEGRFSVQSGKYLVVRSLSNTTFSFVEDCPTAFHSGFIICIPIQQEFLLLSHPCQHLVLLDLSHYNVFLILVTNCKLLF